MKKSAKPARPFRNVKRNGSRFVESIRDSYDPDEEFRDKNSPAVVPRFYKTLLAEDEKGGAKKPDLVETARIVEVNRFGAIRVRVINSSAEMRKALTEANEKRPLLRKIIESGVRFREAGEFKTREIKALKKIAESAKFREDFAVSSSAQNPFDEYIPLMGGPFSHQLYLHDMLDALAKSFEAWNHNPLAHQIVKITTHFVLGRGVTFKARDPLVQKRFAEWWDKNDMGGRLEFWSDMLSRDGELMVRVYRNPVSKSVFVRWVDPSTIWEIVTDLEDIERVFYYHQQYPTAFQVLYGAGPNKRFDPTKFGSSKYVINQIPADEIHHIKINCSPNEKRGRSDLFSILGWLKRYKDFQTAVVLRAIIQATFAWKNKLEGTDTDVDAFINAFGTDQPEFGSVWVENGASELMPMTADLKGGDGLADCPGIVNAIAVGSGVPKEYLGLTEHGTRATAVVASEPGVKKFQARQLLIGRLLKDIAQDWYENEIASGSIPKSQPGEDGIHAPTDGEIEFSFPEIAVEDRSAKLADIQTSQQAGYISKKRAATMSARELGIEDYDYEKEQEDIADEKAVDAASIYSAALGAAGGEAPDDTAGVNDALGNQGQEDAPVGPKKAGGLSGKEKRAIKTNDRR